MNSMLEWRSHLLPDLFDWFESGIAGLPGMRGAPGLHGIRIEEQITDDAYRLRAELPGLDPERDIDLSVTGDVLTLQAERREETEHKRHSEFRYGALARSVRLPSNARWGEATAEYKDGILTVTIPMSESKESASRTIRVQRKGS
ncbi:Hsp20/alpha crystallin family protein [Streptomyces rimosus]|uniref:Hsp20/alpha crystallin family protein n=1 Tax=Streptomyces rimosus TaxID=1927 RepID=UPI0006B27432|nr:Hsp20/alpha crystallin family protein [Streptomyces rimosus]